MAEKEYLICAGWTDSNEIIGSLFIDDIDGKETISIEITSKWINDNPGLILDPDIFNYRGRQYPPARKKTFGFLSDASPDRWGRTLIERREIVNARMENRPIKHLGECDYLLGVHDGGRLGGIRFMSDTGEFLDNSVELAAPPIEELRKLEHAALEFEKSGNYDNDWIKALIAPGSSLGGTRPKANVLDTDGTMWIAKFPSKSDIVNVGAWEKVANDLAAKCGIDTPMSKNIRFSEFGDTFIVKRFDRIMAENVEKRIHFASAMNMLGKIDGDTDNVSYLDIAEIIEEVSASPKNDLKEMWQRMVFNILISNTDDHLRNHGFILEDKGWTLSPVFDINPTYDKGWMAININDRDSTKDVRLAKEVAEYFRINAGEAKTEIEKMQTIISRSWKTLATKLHIPKAEQAIMSAAFSECDRR